jgi:transcriptional regulator with PAS, ATPase and Fis domain
MKQTGQIDMIGTSSVISELKAEIERVARSDAKVLITGESGVGKEVVARAINFASPRVNQPFTPVNCAGIPETLLESELFGHVRGSFTGAYRDKPGKLEMSDNGTIFLDEIGEMTLRMQGLLLRFLETGEIQKVGAERVTKVTNVRVITATNRNLQDLIGQGQFRADLFYRINVVHLPVPPLRDRREDIPLLVDHFLRRFTTGDSAGHGGSLNGNGNGHTADADVYVPNRHSPVRAISTEALARLCEYHWPGNVRQVENIIERLVVTGRREVIEAGDLPHDVLTPAQYGIKPAFERRRTIADELFKNVRELVHKGLEQARGNYKIVLRLFNMEPTDYKRFLNFLRKHDCQLPFKEYRYHTESPQS